MAQYRLHDPEKGIIGPVSIATARDLVKAGVVHDGVWVSRDGGPFLPIKAFEELSPPPKRAKQEDPPPTYSGDLGKNTFFKVFHRFHVTRSTGLLAVQRDDKRKDIFLELGQPTFVASNVRAERLGEFLVARGRLERHELEVALQSMHTDRNRLGHTLTRLGLLEADLLYGELRAQQLARLVDLCNWESGRYQFFDGQRYRGDRVDLQLDASELVIAAARGLDLSRLELRLANLMHAIPERTQGQIVGLDKLRFTALESRVVDSIDGRSTVNQIVAEIGEAPKRRRSVLMVLYLLWELEAVQFRRA